LLAVRVGDRVVVTQLPQASRRGSLTRVSFRVTGIVHIGIDVYDEHLAVASLMDAQQISGGGDQVMGVEVQVKDIDRSDEVARAIERALVDRRTPRRTGSSSTASCSTAAGVTRGSMPAPRTSPLKDRRHRSAGRRRSVRVGRRGCSTSSDRPGELDSIIRVVGSELELSLDRYP